jgi:L,D-transpeptidase ErfK/SrfK
MSMLQQIRSNRRALFGLTISIRRICYLIVVPCCLIASAAFALDRSDTSQAAASPPSSAPASSAAPNPGSPAQPIAHQMVGDEFDFTVADGDSFTTIGSRLGESPRILARDNGKEVGDRLHAGDTVHVNNRHIVPVEESDSIEVNLPQRMLFHFDGSELGGVYPVAVGQPGKQWQTPIGSFVVIQMRKDPTWRVPWSIQREEKAEGKKVVDEIQPGPNNPLGKYWIGLSAPVIGIHGTNHPSTVYSDRSHGCMRLRPGDIEALFNDIDLNDRVDIIYMPLLLAQLDDGRIFLESVKDIYHKGTGGIAAVRGLAQANGIESQIDWTRAVEVVNDAEGIARDVSFHSEHVNASKKPISLATNDKMPAEVAVESLMPDFQCRDLAPRDVPAADAGPTRCRLLPDVKVETPG